MALFTKLQNDYGAWTNSGFTLETGNTVARKTSPDDYVLYTATIKKTFSLSKAVDAATLTVVVDRLKNYHHGLYYGEEGAAEARVKITYPDTSEETLAEDTGVYASGPYNILNAMDMASRLNAAGEYEIELRARVKSIRYKDFAMSYLYLNQWVKFSTVLLQTDTLHTVDLTETISITEYFSKADDVEFVEQIPLTEHFVITHLPPRANETLKTIIAKDADHKTYDFVPPANDCRYDTRVHDFGYPEIEKTFNKGMIWSDSPSPHSVDVWFSLDHGATWNYLDTIVVSNVAPALFWPWATGYSVQYSFRGNAMYLTGYLIWAQPQGPIPGEST